MGWLGVEGHQEFRADFEVYSSTTCVLFAAIVGAYIYIHIYIYGETLSVLSIHLSTYPNLHTLYIHTFTHTFIQLLI